MATKKTFNGVTYSYTDKQILFCESYLKHLNGTQAARDAMYKGNDKTLGVVASENLAKPSIRAYIKNAMSESIMSREEVLFRLGVMATASMADVLDIDTTTGTSRPNFQKALENGKINAIKSVTASPSGHVKIELHNQRRALENVGKYHRLFADRVENFNYDMNMLPDEYLDRIAEGEDVGRVFADFFQSLSATNK